MTCTTLSIPMMTRFCLQDLTRIPLFDLYFLRTPQLRVKKTQVSTFGSALKSIIIIIIKYIHIRISFVQFLLNPLRKHIIKTVPMLLVQFLHSKPNFRFVGASRNAMYTYKCKYQTEIFMSSTTFISHKNILCSVNLGCIQPSDIAGRYVVKSEVLVGCTQPSVTARKDVVQVKVCLMMEGGAGGEKVGPNLVWVAQNILTQWAVYI